MSSVGILTSKTKGAKLSSTVGFLLYKFPSSQNHVVPSSSLGRPLQGQTQPQSYSLVPLGKIPQSLSCTFVPCSTMERPVDGWHLGPMLHRYCATNTGGWVRIPRHCLWKGEFCVLVMGSGVHPGLSAHGAGVPGDGTVPAIDPQEPSTFSPCPDPPESCVHTGQCFTQLAAKPGFIPRHSLNEKQLCVSV